MCYCYTIGSSVVLVQVRLGTEVLRTQSLTRPPDHDSTLNVTETPALTIWPSVT